MHVIQVFKITPVKLFTLAALSIETFTSVLLDSYLQCTTVAKHLQTVLMLNATMGIFYKATVDLNVDNSS